MACRHRDPLPPPSCRPFLRPCSQHSAFQPPPVLALLQLSGTTRTTSERCHPRQLTSPHALTSSRVISQDRYLPFALTCRSPVARAARHTTAAHSLIPERATFEKDSVEMRVERRMASIQVWTAPAPRFARQAENSREL
eukprot:362671-Chlamydomonas_euryale.AAC.10